MNHPVRGSLRAPRRRSGNRRRRNGGERGTVLRRSSPVSLIHFLLPENNSLTVCWRLPVRRNEVANSSAAAVAFRGALSLRCLYLNLPLFSVFPPVFVWLLRALLHYPYFPPQVLLAAPGKSSSSPPFAVQHTFPLTLQLSGLSARTIKNRMISVSI